MLRLILILAPASPIRSRTNLQRLLPVAVVVFGALLGHSAATGWPVTIPAWGHPIPGPADDRSASVPLDRTIIPIPEPQPPAITELDVRNAMAPPRFEVKAPAGA